MDWFEQLTGFPETTYDETRRQLEVEGRTLRSRANGRSFGIGHLELVPLQTLRARVAAAGGPLGRLTVRNVRGDVRAMHREPQHEGALFQVASQFNLLEMASPRASPEDGVTIYQYDRTQGPACAIAAGAGTIYRNYFAPIGADGALAGQTREHQLDGLADVGAALGIAQLPARSLYVDVGSFGAARTRSSPSGDRQPLEPVVRQPGARPARPLARRAAARAGLRALRGRPRAVRRRQGEAAH